MTLDKLCLAVKNADHAGVVRELRDRGEAPLDAFDAQGYTPLMHAVRSAPANRGIVRLLLEHGADPNARARAMFESGCSVLSLALGAGDPDVVAALLDGGAALHYSRDGYDALVDAVHGRDIARDDSLIELLQLLIKAGAALDTITPHGESGLRVLSRIGRFDAVALLLAAGADAAPLGWTPLLRAVAIGTLADVAAEIGAADLEQRDYWERTAWLVAIAGGDIEKAQLLRDCGADVDARGRCESPALFHAIRAHRHPMLAWLLSIGIDTTATDQFGSTALICAADHGNVDAIDRLLAAGADVDGDIGGTTALWHAVDAPAAQRLLDAGADLQNLQYEQRRTLLRLPARDPQRLDVSAAEFATGRDRRFGTRNAEAMNVPFWQAMVRSGITGYEAAERFETSNYGENRPIWCAQRFGQSLTFLPDGRIVEVGGEHEDSYDPDFCIYNDVFVHEPGGTLRIYGYPEAVFPPTDFHTATRVGDRLWLIGSLGYAGTRISGTTPVYCLDLRSLRMAPIRTTGEAPGWISRHRAVLESPTQIRVWGGKIIENAGGQERYNNNHATFTLDLRRARWQRSA